MDTGIFIAQLPKKSQEKVRVRCIEYLRKEGFETYEINEVMSNVMDDRLWVVEDFIEIDDILGEMCEQGRK